MRRALLNRPLSFVTGVAEEEEAARRATAAGTELRSRPRK